MAEIHADPAPAPVPKGILLKADTIAEPFLAEVKANLAAVLSPSSSPSTTGRQRGPPKLVGILATASAAPSRSYAEFTRRQCVALGFAFELREVDQDDGVEDAIIEANADSSVDGIMVRLAAFPIFHRISKRANITSQVYYPIFGKEQVHLVSSSGHNTISNTRNRTTTCSRSSHPSRTSKASTTSFTTTSTTSYVPSPTALTSTLRSDLRPASATLSRSPYLLPRPLSQQRHR